MWGLVRRTSLRYEGALLHVRTGSNLKRRCRRLYGRRFTIRLRVVDPLVIHAPQSSGFFHLTDRQSLSARFPVLVVPQFYPCLHLVTAVPLIWFPIELTYGSTLGLGMQSDPHDRAQFSFTNKYGRDNRTELAVSLDND